MSKRKPKHAHGSKIAAKAQRTKSDVVRSMKAEVLPSAAGSSEAPPKPSDGSMQEVPIVENRAASLPEMTKPSDSIKGFNVSLTTVNVQAYQAKLLEIAQANMQFVFELALRLANSRSPFEIPSVIAEFTSKRIDMFRKYSKEVTELSTRRLI